MFKKLIQIPSYLLGPRDTTWYQKIYAKIVSEGDDKLQNTYFEILELIKMGVFKNNNRQDIDMGKIL